MGIYSLRHKYMDKKGQIAVLITLFVCLVFLLLAIVINLGRIAQIKTLVSNAADAGSLYVASQLSSYTHYLCETYIEPGSCRKCELDIWAVVLAITALLLIVAPAVFGATAAGAWTTATWTTFAGVALGVINLVFIEPAAMKKINRDFLKMSLKQRYAESAVSTALYYSVSDPNKSQDIYDVDEDGSQDDKVSDFVRWYAARTGRLAMSYAEGIKEFSEGGASSGNRAAFFAALGVMNTRAIELRNYLIYQLIPVLAKLQTMGVGVSFWIPDPEASVADIVTLYDAGDTVGLQNLLAYLTNRSYEDYGGGSGRSDPIDWMLSELEDGESLISDPDPFKGDGFIHDTARGQDIVSSANDAMEEAIFYDPGTAFDVPHDPPVALRCYDPINAPLGPDETYEAWYNVLECWWNTLQSWKDELDFMIAAIPPLPPPAVGKDPFQVFLDDAANDPRKKLEYFMNELKQFQGDIRSYYTDTSPSTVWPVTEYAVYCWQERVGSEITRHIVRVKLYYLRKKSLPYVWTGRGKGIFGVFKKCAEVRNREGDVGVSVTRFDEPLQSNFKIWDLTRGRGGIFNAAARAQLKTVYNIIEAQKNRMINDTPALQPNDIYLSDADMATVDSFLDTYGIRSISKGHFSSGLPRVSNINLN